MVTERNDRISLLRRAIKKIDTKEYEHDHCLTLWGVLNFNHECGQMVGNLVQRHPQTISCMSFMFCMFQQDSLRAIGLQHCVNLTTLHIKCCTLGDEGLTEIVDAILLGHYAKNTLHELNVRRSQISAMGLVHVTRLFLNCSHLKRLLLRGNEGMLDDLKV
jgi:Leucine Rich repeat